MQGPGATLVHYVSDVQQPTNNQLQAIVGCIHNGCIRNVYWDQEQNVYI